eukprot:6180430-Pleurochrysis_carterae.AAC.1
MHLSESGAAASESMALLITTLSALRQTQARLDLKSAACTVRQGHPRDAAVARRDHEGAPLLNTASLYNSFFYQPQHHGLAVRGVAIAVAHEALTCHRNSNPAFCSVCAVNWGPCRGAVCVLASRTSSGGRLLAFAPPRLSTRRSASWSSASPRCYGARYKPRGKRVQAGASRNGQAGAVPMRLRTRSLTSPRRARRSLNARDGMRWMARGEQSDVSCSGAPAFS